VSNRKKRRLPGPNKRQKPTGPPLPPDNHTAAEHGHAHSDDDVWIFTEPLVDGSGYMVTINAGKDKAATLTPGGALRYAQHLLWVASRAEYDSLVGQQLYKLMKDQPFQDEPPEATVAHLINDLRKDRPELDDTVTYPLTFSPLVNTRWEPHVEVSVDGQGTKGQWDLTAARRHALGVLEAVHVADLDAGYLRLLKSIGIEEGTASAVVNGLSELRDMSFF
jgi:hypothetical protein